MWGDPLPPHRSTEGTCPGSPPIKAPNPQGPFGRYPYLVQRAQKAGTGRGGAFPRARGGGKGWEAPTPPRHVPRVLAPGPHEPLTPPRSFRELPLLGPKGSKAGREGWGFPQGTEGGGVGSPNPLRAKGTCSGALQAPNPQGPFGCYPYLVQRAKRQAGKDGWGLFQGPASP